MDAPFPAMGRAMKHASLFAEFGCLAVAVIWGSGFIASQLAIDAGLSAPVIMALRFSIAAALMLAVCLPRLKRLRRGDLACGGLAGIFLFGAFFTQIVSQHYTTVSHCAFLTAANVVIVPFVAWALGGRRPTLRTLGLVCGVLSGIGLLTLKPGEGFSFNFGDGLALLGAVLFALHISYLGACLEGRDPLLINLVQVGAAALISLAVLFLWQGSGPPAVDWRAGLLPAVYLGAFSTCLCYLLQTVAQKHTSATRAGLLLSTEGLFGSVFSVALGYEPLTVNLLAGGALIFVCVLLLELLQETPPGPSPRRRP